MADVSVRPARPEDAELVARVQLATWAAAYAFIPGLDLPLVQVAAVWLNAIEAPPSPAHRVLVACERDQVVGFAAYEPSDGGVELSTLLVEPTWSRRGHGSRLLAACVDHWTGSFSVAQTWVLEQDEVMAGFLASTGWAPDGQTRQLDTGESVLTQRRMHTAM